MPTMTRIDELAERAGTELGPSELGPRHAGGGPEDCARVVREVIDEHGRLDTVLRVNLSGAFYMSKPALVHMLERGSGRVINISSITGEIGNVGQANYAASKAGLLGLTKTLAREAALSVSKSGKDDRIGLTVNAVTPGLIETDMTAAVPAKALERLRAAIPVRRIGRPDEVARVVGFLAADASGYITGQAWAVNGGLDM
jgi:acetoacetyl-CoA reductase/3-oxoacyl-[acyl-carrier protein] reductase